MKQKAAIITLGYYVAFVFVLAFLGFNLDKIIATSLVMSFMFGTLYVWITGEKTHREI